MYALEKGLGWKWLAVLFAFFTAFASFGIGNTVQANAIATIAEHTYGFSPYAVGAVICHSGWYGDSWRSEEHIQRLQYASALHGFLLCAGVHLHPLCQCCFCLAGCQADLYISLFA
jgi:hypothetical protein